MTKGTFYRWWSRFIHRNGYHHTRTIYPVDPTTNTVAAIAKCDWCGLSARAPRFT